MIIDVQCHPQYYLESVITFDMCVDSDSTASSSSTPSSSFLTDDFWFNLKNALDGTPVPHSSAGELVDEGSGVDITEGRGTVEPDNLLHIYIYELTQFKGIAHQPVLRLTHVHLHI